MIPPVAWRDLIGLPYQDGARGPDAYDCIGAMAAVLRNWLGVEVSDTEPPIEERAPWRWVALAYGMNTPGAVVLTRSPDGKRHVWIVLEPGLVLSSLPERGVCTVPSRFIARGAEAVVGCYLHEGVPPCR